MSLNSMIISVLRWTMIYLPNSCIIREQTNIFIATIHEICKSTTQISHNDMQPTVKAVRKKRINLEQNQSLNLNLSIIWKIYLMQCRYESIFIWQTHYYILYNWMNNWPRLINILPYTSSVQNSLLHILLCNSNVCQHIITQVLQLNHL